LCLLTWLLVTAPAETVATAQVSSIGARRRAEVRKNPPPASTREEVVSKRNKVYDAFAWTAVPAIPPKTFKVHDLVTIIVRQRSKYEADAESEQRKDWDLQSELDAFIKFTQGGIGASAFRRGRPNIDYTFENRLRGQADLEREDKLTTRVTAEIIDIKPNGNLVIQGRSELHFDDEHSVITITGTCRKNDITEDNTILSTQVGDLTIHTTNEGALRSATKRGWIPYLIDLLSPI
jgi:flagellar L-ring protein precursor FlgH